MITYTFFAFLCSLLYSLSSVFCKYGLQHDIDVRTLSLNKLVVFLAGNKIWLLGVLLALVANFAMIQIQSWLDVSVVYSILNFSYIFVLVLGHFFLREELNQDQWLGIAIVITGTLLILGIDDKNTGQPTAVANLLTLTAASILTIATLVSLARYHKHFNYEILYAISTGLCFGLVETYLKATTNLAADAGGGFSVFSLSSLREFVSVWPFYVMFCYGALGWLFLQITYSHGNVSVTVPVVAVTQRILSMFGGYYVYGEFFGWVKIMGIVAVIVGIFVLVSSTLRIEEPKTI